MIEAKIEENKISQKVSKKKALPKTKTRLIQNVPKETAAVWYASILF